MKDGWNPSHYSNFKDARRAPFDDLVRLIQPAEGARICDLGCGSGALTSELHRTLGAKKTIGLDSSDNMLLASTNEEPSGVELRHTQLMEDFPNEKFNIIVSNSALNWIPNHSQVIAQLYRALEPEGQLAIQVPYNIDHPFYTCAQVVARSDEFQTQLKGYVYETPVQSPEFYSRLLADIGFHSQRVGTWFYPQTHENFTGIVAFAKGGLLSAYRARLEAEVFDRFVNQYTHQLQATLGTDPIFFPFRRVFIWGQRT